jgi:hypothetical protein
LEKPSNENPQDADDIAAVGAIVKALRPFAETERQRIVDSALTLLGSSRPREIAGSTNDTSERLGAERSAEGAAAPAAPRDIRELRGHKQPRTANEMASVAAYYLSRLAPAEMRQDYITSRDVTKYFEQAGFPQPGDALATLINAKNAGYFDSLGDGKYRLNPVGQNLVTHGLPKKAEGAPAVRTRPKRRVKATKPKSRK